MHSTSNNAQHVQMSNKTWNHMPFPRLPYFKVSQPISSPHTNHTNISTPQIHTKVLPLPHLQHPTAAPQFSSLPFRRLPLQFSNPTFGAGGPFMPQQTFPSQLQQPCLSTQQPQPLLMFFDCTSKLSSSLDDQSASNEGSEESQETCFDDVCSTGGMGGETGEYDDGEARLAQRESVQSVLGKRNQAEMLEDTDAKDEEIYVQTPPSKRQKIESESQSEDDQKERSPNGTDTVTETPIPSPKVKQHSEKNKGEITADTIAEPAETTKAKKVNTKEDNNAVGESIATDSDPLSRTFAVFVCGPDPTQNVEDPNSPNLRGKTYITLLQSKDANANEKWEEYMIYRDQYPTKEQILSFDGIVITGSKHDAFTDDAAWKTKLCEIIRDLYDYNESVKGTEKRGIKLLGICFGHQIIIQALTNKLDEKFVGRNDKKKGLELGLMDIELEDSFRSYCSRFDIDISGDIKTLAILEAHQDVVYKLPDLPDTEVMASSPFTDVEMYHIGDYMMCVQGHPEFTTEYLSGAIKKNQKLLKLSDEEANQKLKSLKEKDPDTKEWKLIFQTWFRK